MQVVVMFEMKDHKQYPALLQIFTQEKLGSTVSPHGGETSSQT